MMDILMSETCWAHKKWNKIANDIKLVFYSSTNGNPCLTSCHGVIVSHAPLLYHKSQDIFHNSSSCVFVNCFKTCSLIAIFSIWAEKCYMVKKIYFIYCIFPVSLFAYVQKDLFTASTYPSHTAVTDQLSFLRLLCIGMRWCTEKGGLGCSNPPSPPKFWRPSKIVPNSIRSWKLLKIAEFRMPKAVKF